VIRNWNLDVRINPDSDTDVCQNRSQNVVIHSLVGVSHFAKYRKNRPVTVSEMLINLLKISYSVMVMEIEK